jgi:hypothetical protein
MQDRSVWQSKYAYKERRKLRGSSSNWTRMIFDRPPFAGVAWPLYRNQAPQVGSVEQVSLVEVLIAGQ